MTINPKFKKIENTSWLSGEWNVLEKINLNNKSISEIVPLSTVSAPFLTEIVLSSNTISDVACFIEAYFPNLTILDLSTISFMKGKIISALSTDYSRLICLLFKF